MFLTHQNAQIIACILLPAVTVVRDRKIWTSLRTYQIAGLVTVPSCDHCRPQSLRFNT